MNKAILLRGLNRCGVNSLFRANLSQKFGIYLAPRTLVLLVGYAFCIAVSLFFSYLLRFDFIIPHDFQVEMWMVLSILLPLKLLILFGFSQFSGFAYFFRMPDLIRLFSGLLLASVFLLLWWFVYEGELSPPRGVIMSDFVTSLMLIGSFRIGLRMIRERGIKNNSNFSKVQRVAIIGATDLGASLAADLLARKSLGMRPVVFLDYTKSMIGRHIHGISVVDKPKNLQKVKEQYHLDKVIIALPYASPQKIKEIHEIATRCGMEAELIPSMHDLVSGQVKASHVRSVELEDILGREPVKLDSENIALLIKDKIVMVTGAGGSIGSELCRQIVSKYPRRLLLVEQSEVALFIVQQELNKLGYSGVIVSLVADILDEPRMRVIMERFRPEIVFHSAAHKHVYMMERQPQEAIKNNVLGTHRVAGLASEFNVQKFVLISTDKAINPTSVMGVTKRLAEVCVLGHQNAKGNQTQFMAVRFGNVLGSSGSVIPIFKKQISDGGPVTVTHPEVTRYFMTIPEAVGLVLQSATQGLGGEIFVLDMGKPVKIVDIARQLIELSGFKPDIDIEIKFIGLKPGEKLFEELQHEVEELLQTDHPRIMCLKCRSNASDTLPPFDLNIDELFSGLDYKDSDELKKLLKSRVPEYTPYFEEAL